MKIEELIKAYEEYIELMQTDFDRYSGIGFAHGVTTPLEDIEKGKELRQRIKELKEIITKSSESEIK